MIVPAVWRVYSAAFYAYYVLNDPNRNPLPSLSPSHLSESHMF